MLILGVIHCKISAHIPSLEKLKKWLGANAEDVRPGSHPTVQVLKKVRIKEIPWVESETAL